MALGLGGLVLLVVVAFVYVNWWRHPKRTTDGLFARATGPGVFKVSDIPKDRALTEAEVDGHVERVLREMSLDDKVHQMAGDTWRWDLLRLHHHGGVEGRGPRDPHGVVPRDGSWPRPGPRPFRRRQSLGKADDHVPRRRLVAPAVRPCGEDNRVRLLPIDVSVEVRNAGSRSGEEIVQLYAGFPRPTIDRPVKLLRGFDKVSLAPGETRTVRFTLKATGLAQYDVASPAWRVEATTTRCWSAAHHGAPIC